MYDERTMDIDLNEVSVYILAAIPSPITSLSPAFISKFFIYTYHVYLYILTLGLVLCLSHAYQIFQIRFYVVNALVWYHMEKSDMYVTSI